MRVGEVSPKDLHVLAVTLESDSQFIVTSNGKDYPDHCGVAVPVSYTSRIRLTRDFTAPDEYTGNVERKQSHLFPTTPDALGSSLSADDSFLLHDPQWGLTLMFHPLILGRYVLYCAHPTTDSYNGDAAVTVVEP